MDDARIPLDKKNVVFGNPRNPEERVRTSNAKWLKLDSIFNKLHRPNFYDIGGTYVTEDVGDYWFVYKTEQVGNLFLLHLFITSFQEATFTLAISSNNNIQIDKKLSAVFLPTSLKDYYFDKTKEHVPNYVTTYSFTTLDVEFLEDKTLYIPIDVVDGISRSIHKKVIEDVKFCHDFSALLTDPTCSDFTIESSDGHIFKVHKALLAAHSEVFKAMLKEETAESQNGYVKLVDVPKEEMEYILEFIYSGTIKEVGNCNFCYLLMLADQYNIKGLKNLSQYFLSQQICIDNAVEVLMAADMYNSESLKVTAMKFIKGNKVTLQSSAFKEIKNADLLRELCEYLIVV